MKICGRAKQSPRMELRDGRIWGDPWIGDEEGKSDFDGEDVASDAEVRNRGELEKNTGGVLEEEEEEEEEEGDDELEDDRTFIGEEYDEEAAVDELLLEGMRWWERRRGGADGA